MDVRGIAWVGNLYQKFETMCLEVEDIICQDTAKYVENQVETVGASVRRFYSDVMQDLLPPSALKDEKVAVCNSALDQYKNVVICKKPVMSMKIGHLKFDEEKSTENSKALADTRRDIIRKLPYGLHHAENPFPTSSQFSTNGVHVNSYSQKQCDENIHHELDLSGRESSRTESKHLTETSKINLTSKEANDASSCCAILGKNCEASCVQTDKMETTVLVKDTRCDAAVQSSKEIEIEIEDDATDSEIDHLSSDVSSKSIENNEKDMRHLSNGDSSAELNAGGIYTIDGSVTVIESSLNEDVWLNDYPDGEISMFHIARSDAWSPDEVDCDAILEHESEKILQEDEKKLDEACILVDGDDFHFEPHEETKHKPYKKKVSRAFSFIKKSKRKQEYEELAIKYGYGFDTNPKKQQREENNPEPNLKIDKQKAQTEDDWQLL